MTPKAINYAYAKQEKTSQPFSIDSYICLLKAMLVFNVALSAFDHFVRENVLYKFKNYYFYCYYYYCYYY